MGEPLKVDVELLEFYGTGANEEEILRHVGVLGMRWGRRKGRASGKAPAHTDHDEARALQKKGSKNLSSEELKKLNNRLQLEKQFKELTGKKQNKSSSLVKKLLETGKTADQFYNLANGPMGKDVRGRAAKSKMGQKLTAAMAKKATGIK